ncbi:NnrS family protein [Pseudoxanthomonas japonensis]|uniref:NnrS family protein n=1 Tax=Pseudoxanthomonas japonensis TaxID=69284 RepID=UPI001BCFB4E1|nr:NnrS family protein [Pseudoxanthomonas japonensis]
MKIDIVAPPRSRTAVPLPGPSPAWLAHAPHRLMFFIGAGNVLLAMLWWTLWLVATRWGLWTMPETPIYAGWLHAFLMQYLVLPSFIFGFLLTVFPRWMGMPDLKRWHYVPVGLGLMGGQLAILLGVAGWQAGLTVGLWMALAGWTAALLTLGRLLADDTATTWHARSCFAGLLLGWLGLAMFIAFALGASPTWAFASIKLGGFGLLLPVYVTVAHRMFPFFAGNVVPGYVPWRSLRWLGAVWALLMAHLGLELVHAYAWLWLADVPLLVLTAWAVHRWWPRGRMPGLLAVLFIGTAWLPITFLLYVVQSVTFLATDEFILGRAPMHAMFVGFFGSLLVAMVTRVTQGHSGRPLAMTKVAWFAFVAIQVVAVMRIVADLAPDAMAWQAAAAVGWLLALAPWVGRIGGIYLSPRADGRPG